jgi:hypothetical protein
VIPDFDSFEIFPGIARGVAQNILKKLMSLTGFSLAHN